MMNMEHRSQGTRENIHFGIDIITGNYSPKYVHPKVKGKINNETNS